MAKVFHQSSQEEMTPQKPDLSRIYEDSTLSDFVTTEWLLFQLLNIHWGGGKNMFVDFYPPHGGSIRGFFFVGNFIKYGQYQSVKVNHSQLMLIKVN